MGTVRTVEAESKQVLQGSVSTGQRKMSQLLGSFGLLDFTVLRPVLAWRAFWNLWTVYLLSFQFLFRAAVNRGYWISRYGGTTVLSIFSIMTRMKGFLRIDSSPILPQSASPPPSPRAPLLSRPPAHTFRPHTDVSHNFVNVKRFGLVDIDLEGGRTITAIPGKISFRKRRFLYGFCSSWMLRSLRIWLVVGIW
jgi:hypothetical protein